MHEKHNPVGSNAGTPPADGASPIEILARGLLIDRGRVLLCRNVEGGYRYLPGGHVEPGEPAADALAREFFEESGVRVRVGALALTSEHRFVQSGRPRHELNLVFHVEHPGMGADAVLAAWPSLEPGIAFDWVALSDLAAADLRPQRISDWLRARVKGGDDGKAGGLGGPGSACGWLSDMGS